MTAPGIVDLYLRKSTKDEGRSVDRQLAELTDAAGDEGLAIGRVFCDPDFSASRYKRRERPDYAALLTHITRGQCQVLGILEASRGSRDLTEWSMLLDLCRKLRVRIWVRSHERIYDLSRRRDWRALADEGLDAADESEKISERVLSGKRKAAREGTPAGRLQYGFTRVYDGTGKFVEQVAHPEQAPVVAEMVRRVAVGDTLFTIASDLNARGIMMPGGRPWRGALVRQMVLRPSYAGRRIHQGEDVGPASWAPIVDVTEWRKAVAVLTRAERRSTTRGTALTHWLTGVVTCGGCRRGKLRAITGGKARPTAVRYTCDGRDGCGKVFVSARALESVVEAMILARLQKPDALQSFVPRTDDAALAAAERELNDLKEQLDQWRTLAKARKVSPASFAEFEADLLPKIEEAEQAVRRLSLPATLPDLDAVDVVALWPDFAPKVKREYVRVLADLVVAPASRRGPVFDHARLGESRWVGDSHTWAEYWK